jgi:hypothetical protein
MCLINSSNYVYLTINYRIVRTGNSVIKNLLVLSLLVIYLGIALAYLFYLPKYSPLRPSNNRLANKSNQFLIRTQNKGHQAHDILVLLHRAYKTTVENKRASQNILSPLTLMILSLTISGIAFSALSRNTNQRFKPSAYGRPYAYLSNRALRI